MATAMFYTVSPALASSLDSSEAPTARIFGGKASKRCAWPSTIGFGGCTGTLVHPQIVLYAAHCGKQRKVVFGESYRGAVKTIPVKFCKINPQYQGITKGTDFAFCVLSKPVKGVTIAPIAYGCELEQIKPGARVWSVGFGKTDRGGSGVKHEVEVPVNKLILNDREVMTGGNGKATCYGDSGGPTFIQLSDGSWRIMGITSYGTSSQCGYPSGLTMANIAVPWIHKELKAAGMGDIDLTPCYKDDGTWDPGEGCTEFPLELGTGFGAWNNMCSEGAKLSGPSTICAPDGQKVPTVQIEGPDSKDVIEVGQTIEIRAQAKDESGKAPKVELMINGKSDSELTKAPYKWSIKAEEAGPLTLQLIATNATGNQGKSKTLKLKVVEPEEPEESEEPENNDQGQDTSPSQDGEDDNNDSPEDNTSPTPNEEEEDSDDASEDPNTEASESEDSDADSDDPAKQSGCRMQPNNSGRTLWASMLIVLLTGLRRRHR